MGLVTNLAQYQNTRYLDLTHLRGGHRDSAYPTTTETWNSIYDYMNLLPICQSVAFSLHDYVDTMHIERLVLTYSTY